MALGIHIELQLTSTLTNIHGLVIATNAADSECSSILALVYIVNRIQTHLLN